MKRLIPIIALAGLLAACSTDYQGHLAYMTDPQTGKEVTKEVLGFHGKFPFERCFTRAGEEVEIDACRRAGYDTKYTYKCEPGDDPKGCTNLPYEWSARK